jgi:hypothetical protein
MLIYIPSTLIMTTIPATSSYAGPSTRSRTRSTGYRSGLSTQLTGSISSAQSPQRITRAAKALSKKSPRLARNKSTGSMPKTPPSAMPPPRTPKGNSETLTSLISSPVVNKRSGRVPYTTQHFERNFRMREFGAEMEGKFLGPMPVEEFLNSYLPHEGDQATRPTRGVSTSKVSPLVQLDTQSSEIPMYPVFVSV